jgi:hypothetical protein
MPLNPCNEVKMPPNAPTTKTDKYEKKKKYQYSNRFAVPW